MVNIHKHFPIWTIENIVNIKDLFRLRDKNKLVIFKPL